MMEADLLRFAHDALNKSGLLWWRVSNGASLYSKGTKTFFRKSPIAGFPDLAGLTRSGQFWALELKSQKGRVSPQQHEWIDKINLSGGRAEIARCPLEVIDFISRMAA